MRRCYVFLLFFLFFFTSENMVTVCSHCVGTGWIFFPPLKSIRIMWIRKFHQGLYQENGEQEMGLILTRKKEKLVEPTIDAANVISCKQLTLWLPKWLFQIKLSRKCRVLPFSSLIHPCSLTHQYAWLLSRGTEFPSHFKLWKYVLHQV